MIARMRWAPRVHRAANGADLVDGRPVDCSVGDTVAAALVAAGELICRVTREGERRGVFCGMGVCHECVMTVDGAPRAGLHDAGARRDDGRDRAADAAARPRRESGSSPSRSRPTCSWSARAPGGLAAAAPQPRRGRRRRARRRAREAGRPVLQAAASAGDVDELRSTSSTAPGRGLIARPARRAAGCSRASRSGRAAGPTSSSPSGRTEPYTLRPRAPRARDRRLRARRAAARAGRCPAS